MTDKDLLAALRAIRPDLRGWLGCVGRSQGSHSQKYQGLIGRMGQIDQAIKELECSLQDEAEREEGERVFRYSPEEDSRGE